MKKQSPTVKITSVTALILVIAMLMCMAISCADNNQPNDTPDSSGSVSVAETSADAVTTEENRYDENGFLRDSLPEKTNLDTEIVMLYWSDVYFTEFFAEDTGNAVDSAINRRNSKVEDRLGVKINFEGTPGNNANRNSYVAKIRAAYDAGNTYDIYAGYTLAMATTATSGFCANMLDYEALDFTAPWWPSSLVKEATINDKLFIVTGDLSTNLIYLMYVIYFNKTLITDLGLEDPYECVDGNTWTYEKMIKMAHSLDGRQSSSEPIYGFVANTMHTDPFFYGAGLRTIERDADGVPVISEKYNSERTQDVVTLVAEFLADPICRIDSKCNDTFKSGNSLFIMTLASYATQNLTDSTLQYGIAPIPKYTTDQDTFSTCFGFSTTFYALSGAAPHPEEAAMTLECLSSEGYRIITPVLFEVTMKTRYTTDPVAARTFDTARAGVVFDLGRIYSDALGNLTFLTFRNCICKNQPNFARSYIASESTLKTKLDEMIKAFQ